MTEGHAYVSKDGLLRSIHPEAVARWEQIVADSENEERSWTEKLRALGVKFAHPDDGWVKRAADPPYVSLSWYPQFNDNPQVGDLIAFGTPPHAAYGVGHYVPNGDHKRRWKGDFRVPPGEVESACQGYRICRVTTVEDRTGIIGRVVKYFYEDTGLRVPPTPPPHRVRRALFFWRSR